MKMKDDPEKGGAYRSWNAAKSRCYCRSNSAFSSYGGRGIRVAAEWLGPGGFDRFFSYMGPRPRGHSIDRIDNSKGYEPGNVRWASRSTQTANRRMPVGGSTSHLGGYRARLALKYSGKILGLTAAEALLSGIRSELELQFGPPRNESAPVPGSLTVEEAFLCSDFRHASYHYEGLESISEEVRARSRGPAHWMRNAKNRARGSVVESDCRLLKAEVRKLNRSLENLGI